MSTVSGRLRRRCSARLAQCQENVDPSTSGSGGNPATPLRRRSRAALAAVKPGHSTSTPNRQPTDATRPLTGTDPEKAAGDRAGQFGFSSDNENELADLERVLSPVRSPGAEVDAKQTTSGPLRDATNLQPSRYSPRVNRRKNGKRSALRTRPEVTTTVCSQLIDPECNFTQPPKKSYTKRHNMTASASVGRTSEVDDEAGQHVLADVTSLSSSNKTRVDKRRKHPAPPTKEEVAEWMESVNCHFDELDDVQLVVEHS